MKTAYYDTDIPSVALRALEDGDEFVCIKEITMTEGTFRPGDRISAARLATVNRLGKILAQRFFIPVAVQAQEEARRIQANWHNNVYTPALNAVSQARRNTASAIVRDEMAKKEVKAAQEGLRAAQAALDAAIAELELVEKARPA